MDSNIDVIELNRRITTLCVEVESGADVLVDELCVSWRIHERLDRTILYPRIARTRQDSDLLVARAMADHHLIDRMVDTVGDLAGADSVRRHGLLARLIRDHVVAEDRRVRPLLESEFDSGTGWVGTDLGTRFRPEGEFVSVPNPQLDDLPDPCSFGVHDWVTKHNDEGEDYQLCIRCGQRIE